MVSKSGKKKIFIIGGIVLLVILIISCSYKKERIRRNQCRNRTRIQPYHHRISFGKW